MGRLNGTEFKRLLDIVQWRHERPVDLAVAAMVVLATMLLGASYHAPLAIWCSLLLVASSIYLNDVTGWLRLDRKWASWLSLAAVVVWCRRSPHSRRRLAVGRHHLRAADPASHSAVSSQDRPYRLAGHVAQHRSGGRCRRAVAGTLVRAALGPLHAGRTGGARRCWGWIGQLAHAGGSIVAEPKLAAGMFGPGQGAASIRLIGSPVGSSSTTAICGRSGRLVAAPLAQRWLGRSSA